MAMFSFASADLDVDYRDVAAQKRLLRERMAGLGWLAPPSSRTWTTPRTSTSTRSPRW